MISLPGEDAVSRLIKPFLHLRPHCKDAYIRKDRIMIQAAFHTYHRKESLHRVQTTFFILFLLYLLHMFTICLPFPQIHIIELLIICHFLVFYLLLFRHIIILLSRLILFLHIIRLDLYLPHLIWVLLFLWDHLLLFLLAYVHLLVFLILPFSSLSRNLHTFPFRLHLTHLYIVTHYNLLFQLPPLHLLLLFLSLKLYLWLLTFLFSPRKMISSLGMRTSMHLSGLTA